MSNNVLISFPNSGRTWLQFMTKHLGIDCYYTHQGSHHVARYTMPQIIKYVERYPEKLAGKQIALLIRNPLDVMVSSYFQTIHRCGIPMSMHDFIRDDRHGIEKMIKFNLYWREKYVCKMVTYEELHADTHSVLKEVISYYGQSCQDEDIASAVDKYRFDNMRKLEMASTGFEKVFKHTNKAEPEAFKARRGVVGGYVDYLTQEDIDYCNGMLNTFNYHERMEK